MANSTDGLVETFVRLSSCTTGERAAALATIRECDPALADELESLLAAHDASPDFLDQLDAHGAVSLLQEDERLLMPARAGSYRLIREIGRGGLGVVYLADRDDGDFEQRVAVKLIKHGMDSEAILRRFHNERRIVASLQHDHIARLIDGGLLQDGRPWFAMEYVEGEAITDWCIRHQLLATQRLRLMEQVCRAVQYAHSRLIVHRDLKPDNILVTEEGSIKLLDFGIAKLLAEGDDEHTQLTLAGIQAMTPEYAAPEQIRGEPVTVQTDVFALGVILYQLLTGLHPFEGHNTGRAALAEAICDTDPSPPSAAIGTAGAEQDKQRPLVRARQLQGDLDSIVMTAMARDPARRYASVEALAEDIDRHLQGLPIRARRQTRLYGLGRFIARHHLALGATAAVILALTVGLGAAVWQAREARLQAAEVTRQAERAEQVSDFLTELFRVSDPNENRGESLTARDLLERGAARLDDELAGQPSLRVELAGLIARIHVNLGEYSLARPLVDRALAVNRDLVEPALGVKLLSLRGLIEHRMGNYEAAMSWFDRAGAAAQSSDDSLVLADLLNNRGLSERALGRHGAARQSHLQALSIYEAVLGPDDVRIGPTLNNLGLVLWLSMENPEAARPHLERALMLYEKEHGELHPFTLGTSANLGWLLSELGEFDQAEPLLRRGLEGTATVYGEDSEQYGTALLSFGNFQSDRGNQQEAIEIYHQAHDIYVRHLGPTHDYVAYPLRNLGMRYMERNDFSQALHFFDRALEVKREALAVQHPRIAIVQHLRGQALRQLGRLSEAKAAFTEALQIRESQLSENAPRTLQTRFELLITNITQDGPERHRQAAAALLDAFPPESSDHEQARERLRSMGVVLD